MIDTTATEPPRNWFLDLAKMPTEELLAEATGLRAKLAIAQQRDHRVDARAYELRLLDVERAIAIHNRRATEAEDQRAGISAGEVLSDGPLTDGTAWKLIRGLAGCEVAEGRLGNLLAGRMITWMDQHPAQREADLREAYRAGLLRGIVFGTDDPRPLDMDPDTEDMIATEAAEYARSKAGEPASAPPGDAEFIALRAALHKRLEEVGDFHPVVVAAEAWRDGVKGLGSHVEQDLEAAVDFLRSKRCKAGG